MLQKCNTKFYSIDLTTYNMYTKRKLLVKGVYLIWEGYCLWVGVNVLRVLMRNLIENPSWGKRVKEFLLYFFPKFSNKSPICTATPYECICLGKGRINGDRNRLCFGWWVHYAVCREYFVVLYTWNLYGFLNLCHLDTFNKK